jgi:hypothetical protein
MNPNLTQSGCGAEKERRGHGRLDRERHSTVIAAKPYDSTVGLARRCRPKPQARTPRKKMEFAVRNLAPPYWQILDLRSSTGLLPPERNLNLWLCQNLNPWKQKNLVQHLTDTFEGHAQQTKNGIKYWLARDLQHLLGYAKWENFQTVIAKAKNACEVSGHNVQNHFPYVRKMVKIGSGTDRQIDDIMLTRYACYLIAGLNAQFAESRKLETTLCSNLERLGHAH